MLGDSDTVIILTASFPYDNDVTVSYARFRVNQLG